MAHIPWLTEMEVNGELRRVTNLLAVGALVLAVVEVPHIEETINSSQVEETWP